LMVEGASIDKQAHAMDSDRWLLDLLEFDRAVKVAQDFAARDGHTLVIVTADHETGGVAVIGASRVTAAQLQDQATKGGKENLRDPVVGIYERAGFPHYTLAADGYPQSTDIDHKLLIGYGANADRYEDWRTSPRPLRDGQQPFAKQEPMASYPANPLARDKEGGYLVSGQVPGTNSSHTGTDVPLSAFGPGAWSFTGVIDNTDVFFKLAQTAVGGALLPPGLLADLPMDQQPASATGRKTIPKRPSAQSRR
ncbi:MAG: alkaline phosphatase, partial [Pseudomonadota bacterium]|nr:alkaline phosphatase [Pseudomonadota bacterium]